MLKQFSKGQQFYKLSANLDRLVTNDNGLLSTKEVVSGFTIDVIATTSFAIETNTNDEQNGENPFVRNELNLFEINPIRMLSALSMPSWFNALVKVRHSINVQDYDFFTNLAEVLKQRKNQISKRNDLVQLLMDTYAYGDELEDSNYDLLTADASTENSTNETKPNGISSISKSKMAYHKIKLLLASIVPKFRFCSSPKTPSSPQFGSFSLDP